MTVFAGHLTTGAAECRQHQVVDLFDTCISVATPIVCYTTY